MLVAAILTAVVGVINFASAIRFFAVNGFSSSQAGVEIIGFVYPIILFIAAEFIYEQKSWALILSFVLCLLSVTNSIITLGAPIAFLLSAQNWALFLFSIAGAIASMFALAKRMNSEPEPKKNKYRR